MGSTYDSRTARSRNYCILFAPRVTGSWRVVAHVGLDRGTKKSLLVECLEFLPLYFEYKERNTLSLQLLAVLTKILWKLELSGMLG